MAPPRHWGEFLKRRRLSLGKTIEQLSGEVDLMEGAIREVESEERPGVDLVLAQVVRWVEALALPREYVVMLTDSAGAKAE